ncbi:MAG: hypothetical protein BWZ00_01869 [Bacteroidetes bacterium ADurb.BinA174]|nr:MAG: hypothetical protein BWZ00_01869 [Bacteroidetes bacterium ADurb.BinA174]
MFPSFFRRNKFFYFIGKEDYADFIVVLNSGKCQCSCNFCHNVAFYLFGRTKTKTFRNIYQQHHRQFTFFFEDFYIRTVVSSGNVPVYIPHIVAILVFTNFGKRHTTPFKSRMILPRKNVPRQSTCFYFNMSYFF